MIKKAKKGLLLILICLLGVLAIVIWRQQTQVPLEVKSLYSTYMDTIMFDYNKAANELCYFEMPATKRFIEQSDDYVTGYNILSWEKINDELWAVRTSFQTLSIPDGDIMFNFIGKIEGKYYVMINAYQVPAQLHKNFSPLRYIPPNMVPYENVIGLLD